jgi:hypothetical protein
MKPFGRSLSDFPNLSPNEEKLLAHARKGELLIASELDPEALRRDFSKYVIRGGLLRFLILGGDETAPVHDSGIRLRGAFISSDLDFTGCTGMRTFRLDNCYIEGVLKLEVASTSSIYLDGCSVARVEGNRAEINGSLYMRFGFLARHGLDLSGSRVTGSISCRGGAFEPGEQSPDEPVNYCFRIDDADIAGTLILGPRHKDDQRNGDGREPAVRNETKFHGTVSLQGTRCAALFDHKFTYNGVGPGQLRIHGFRYGRLAGINATNAEFRLAWLGRTLGTSNFSPQTYEYLATVLREMGHEHAARRILIARYEQQYQAARELRERRGAKLHFPASLFWRIASVIASAWNGILHTLVRYGYEPWRAIWWSLIPLTAGLLIYGAAYRQGNMVPTNPIMALRPEWIECKQRLEADWEHSSVFGPMFHATTCPTLPDYPRFSAFWYTFDTFVPILAVHQEDYWTPGPRSALIRHFSSVHVVLGWLFVTLGLSSMLGLIQRRAVPGGK